MLAVPGALRADEATSAASRAVQPGQVDAQDLALLRELDLVMNWELVRDWDPVEDLPIPIQSASEAATTSKTGEPEP